MTETKTGTHWEILKNAIARDICISASNHMFAVGSRPSGDNNVIFEIKTNGSDWNATPFSGAQISVEPDGTPWFVQHYGDIYRGSKRFAGGAVDIGVGINGEVWITGTKPEGHQAIVHKLISGSFQPITPITGNRDAFRIAVGSDGNPWVVTKEQEIFRFNGNSWQSLPGGASDIGIGADGSIWITGAFIAGHTSMVYKWSEERFTWDSIGAPSNTKFGAITVTANGLPIVIHDIILLPNEGGVPYSDIPSGTVYQWV